MSLMKWRGLPLLSLLIGALTPAHAAENDPPKWDAGAGFGYLSFEHYPAANQYTALAFPFPTFSYRGAILRADDRDGAKLFLVKRREWVLQFGGLGFPPLNSSTNDARQGMPDLPLLAALGPQLQRNFSDEWSLKIGAYQAIAATWLAAHTSGAIWELDTTYRKAFDFHGHPLIFGIDELSSSLSLNLMGASEEVHSLYYGVSKRQAISSRPAFDAQAGILQSQLSYFQTFKRGNFAFYLGARLSDYRLSANRASPLYKADENFAALMGFTITLIESKSPGIPYEEASGVVDKLQKRH